MNVTFELQTVDGRHLTEGDLDANFDREAPGLAGDDDLFGELVLRHAGANDLRVQDELSPLVTALCRRGAAVLRRGEKIAYNLWSQPGGVDFVPAGDAVTVTTEDDDEEWHYPREELAAELEACGQRYAALLKRLYGAAPAWRERILLLDRPPA